MTGFSFPIVPRYAEIDQQGVVFNGHYLTWFDEAMTGLFDHLDVSYPGLIGSGFDLQVVHSEIDYVSPVRWRDAVRVAVDCRHLGTTSFSLGFTVLAAGQAAPEREAIRDATSMSWCRPRTGVSVRSPRSCARPSVLLRGNS